MITATEASIRSELANDEEIQFINSKAMDFFTKDCNLAENAILKACDKGSTVTQVIVGKRAYKRKLGPYINHQILKIRAIRVVNALGNLGYTCSIPEFQTDSDKKGLEIIINWN